MNDQAGGHREELCPLPDQNYEPIVSTGNLHTT